MRQYSIIYDSQQADIFESELKPLLQDCECDFIAYDPQSLPSLAENSDVLTWLADEDLYHLLPKAAEHKWHIGLIPHSEMKRATKAFFVPKKMQDAIADCMAVENPVSVDLMYCNEELVLGSVMFGNPNIMAPAARIEESIWNKLKHFGSLAINLSKSHLSPYRIETAKQTVINTAALGISVVYRPSSSEFTRRVVAESKQDEASLHTIIFAPRSIVEVARFLFASIFPQKPSSNSLPDYLGHLKTEQVIISGPTALDYSIDGRHLSAEQIQILIKENSLLVLSSGLPEKLSSQDQKESVRVTGLPKGQAIDELINRPLRWIHHADQDEVKETFVILKENARASEAYLVLMVLSTLLATVGLFANSAPVIIGAMILAPLMAPIISLSMGVLRQNSELVTQSSKTLVIGIALALFFGTLLTLMIPLQSINHEIGARLSPTILDLGVAIISGVAGAYASARSEVAKSLAGVAIAVALVPPLAVSGMGIGWLDWEVFSGAFLLFMTNLVGIILAASATFLVMGFSPFHLAKKGMVLSTAFVLVVSIPLVLAFTSMVDEQRIVHTLEGWKTNGIEIKDVKIRSGTPTYVSVKLLSNISLQTEQIDQVKHQMETLLGQNIRLEATTVVVR
ncbi:TIGR00341 family protein [Thiomicrorhabdus arctica]|uniref:TIGR00341 family protein n=1 Tax=Thiomicrorhabdus arctica TaxID=131540 RepID=UPI0003782EF7|nr:TIGR00341 family protein [Thiomicrorhabdus arctica]